MAAGNATGTFRNARVYDIRPALYPRRPWRMINYHNLPRRNIYNVKQLRAVLD